MLLEDLGDALYTRVIAADTTVDQSALVAVDSNDCIVGATRAARKLYGWAGDGDIKPVAATDLFVDNAQHRGFSRAEKAAVMKAIIRADGNMSVAAKALGVGRATLYRRMNRLGIKR